MNEEQGLSTWPSLASPSKAKWTRELFWQKPVFIRLDHMKIPLILVKNGFKKSKTVFWSEDEA